MDSSQHIVVKCRADLDLLLTEHSIRLLPDEGKIILQLDGLSDSKRQKWEKRLSRSFYECGCKTGAFFTVASVVLFTLYVWLSGEQKITSWFFILYGLLVLFLSALVGKIYGLFLAKVRLIRGVRFLKKICSKTDKNQCQSSKTCQICYISDDRAMPPR